MIRIDKLYSFINHLPLYSTVYFLFVCLFHLSSCDHCFVTDRKTRAGAREVCLLRFRERREGSLAVMERYSSKWETPSTVKAENRFFVVLKQILDFFLYYSASNTTKTKTDTKKEKQEKGNKAEGASADKKEDEKDKDEKKSKDNAKEDEKKKEESMGKQEKPDESNKKQSEQDKKESDEAEPLPLPGSEAESSTSGEPADSSSSSEGNNSKQNAESSDSSSSKKSSDEL